MSAFNLFSIGHSNIPIDRFVAMLHDAGANVLADVRSKPVSRFFPWFAAKALAVRLEQEGIGYESYGDRLGGRPRDPSLYCDGVADYEKMATLPEFRTGIEQLLKRAGQAVVCLMCAERDPLDCHRCLLIARSLAERGLAIGHILFDGAIEPHRHAEQRLLALCGEDDDLFLSGQDQRLAAAYRRRARAGAYRIKARGANSVTRSR